MSYKGTKTRAEMVARFGGEIIKKLDAEGCDYTNRLMPSGYEDDVEFSASISATDEDGDDVTLVAYYYQDAADLKDCDDLGSLDWEVEGYDVI